MSEATRRIPTFDELDAEIERLPEHLTGEIFPGGALRTMSRPDRPHRWASQRVQRALQGLNRIQRGVGWWIVDPAMRAVEVYACEGGRPTLVQTAVDDATIALQPFGIDIPLSGWWLPAQP